MPKAYVMIHLEVINEEGFSGFASKIPGLLAEFGGKALVGRDTVVSVDPGDKDAMLSHLTGQLDSFKSTQGLVGPPVLTLTRLSRFPTLYSCLCL